MTEAMSDINIRCIKCREQTHLRRSDDGWHCAACAALVLEVEDSRPCDTEKPELSED